MSHPLDSLGRIIHKDDIVVCNDRPGFVWINEDEYLIAWDLAGPSCEDSESLTDLLKENCVKVVGKLNR